jgi:hypothetical protein
MTLKTAIPSKERVSRWFVARREEIICYDVNMNRWKLTYLCPDMGSSVWSRLLALTVRSPLVDTFLVWRESGIFSLPELRHRFLLAVAHDHKALTRFLGREELVDRVKVAKTFAELVAVWNSLSEPR